MPQFIHQHGLAFVDEAHLKAFEKVTPEKLREDIEWVPAVYIFTMSGEMRRKTEMWIITDHREIEWQRIFDTDFGSGHRAALHWAFSLWSAHCWGGWEDEHGRLIPMVDIASRAFSMDRVSKMIVLMAVGFRWGANVAPVQGGTRLCIS